MAVRNIAAFLALVAVSAADILNIEYAEWSNRGTTEDLFKFVTRPDLTPPKLNIPVHKKDKVAPGYLFLAPYDCLECSHVPVTSYVTQQIGPHIYTQDGELVWSGNELFPDRKMFDFRPIMIDGKHHLSLITPEDSEWRPFPDGLAMILDDSYQPVFSIGTKGLGHRIDMHEFNILNEGETALIGMKIFRHPIETDSVDWKGKPFTGKIMDCSFTEINLKTGERVFNWTASDHINIAEETSNPPPRPGDQAQFWDWLHLNSMDKDQFGNYLISGRATNTIYYLAPNGTILWRLGGPKSDFTQNFKFSRQHHARVQRQSKTNMVVSFFDNAADDSGLWTPTANASGLNWVGLDFNSMTANVFHRMERPDGGLSEAKGNVQYLPNGGVFGGWGENGYMSEYVNPGGEKVYEASFATKRFANYRVYKMPFVGRPKTLPAIKSFVSTNSRSQSMTSIYVSWNGATEVDRWNFYSASSGSKTMLPIGSTPKTGFETNFMAMDYHPIVFAEAVDANGNSLGNSSFEVTEIPKHFHNSENPAYTSGPKKDGLHVNGFVAFMAGIALTIGWQRSRLWKQQTAPRSPATRWMSKRKA